MLRHTKSVSGLQLATDALPNLLRQLRCAALPADYFAAFTIDRPFYGRRRLQVRRAECTPTQPAQHACAQPALRQCSAARNR